MKVKLFITDNNGTVLDDLDVIYGSVTRMYKAFNLPVPTKNQFREEITPDFMEFHRRHGFPPYINEEEEKKLRQALLGIHRAYINENISAAHFRPDVAKTIFELKSMGIRTAMVSGMMESELLEILDQFGFRGVFEPVIGSVKNKEEALAGLCRTLAIPAGSAIYVDDTVEGTSAAKKAGLISVGVGMSGAYHLPERLREVTPIIINKYSDLVRLVRSLDKYSADNY